MVMTDENKDSQILPNGNNDVDVNAPLSESESTPDTKTPTAAIKDADAKPTSETEPDIFSTAVENDSMAFDMLERIARRARRTAWLAFLLAVIVAAGSGYIGWQLLEQQNKIATVDSAFEMQQQQTAALNSELQLQSANAAQNKQRSDQRIAEFEQAVLEANEIIEGQGRRLLSLTATSTDDWRIAEVEYLLRLANQRLLISKDAATALELLAAADQILLQLGDPRLVSIRQSIAGDRTAIAMVGVIDIEGVFASLAAMSNQVNALPLHSEPVFSAAKVDPEPASSEKNVWYATLQRIAWSTWAELKSLVVIQARDPELKPLLPPEQQYYLRNNLRLLLAQAQLALLDGRQEIYRQSLDNAAVWLQDYFPQQESAVQHVVTEIGRLSALQVTSNYPDVSASLLAVKSFIAAQHNNLGAVKEQAATTQEAAQ